MSHSNNPGTLERDSCVRPRAEPSFDPGTDQPSGSELRHRELISAQRRKARRPVVTSCLFLQDPCVPFSPPAWPLRHQAPDPGRQQARTRQQVLRFP